MLCARSSRNPSRTPLTHEREQIGHPRQLKTVPARQAERSGDGNDEYDVGFEPGVDVAADGHREASLLKHLPDRFQTLR